MTKKLNLLAFDFGASNGRAVLGKFDGCVVELTEVHRFPNDPVELVGSFHWDILRLFHEIKQGLVKCSKYHTKDVHGIGIDTWGVDFGLLDGDGKLLGNPYHYRDNRTEGMMEVAFGRIAKRDIYDMTGIQFMRLNSLFQLLSMVEDSSVLLEKADTLLFMPDLLSYFLTGEKSTEFTIATTSQLYNPIKGGWEYGIMDPLGIPKEIFTSIIQPGTVKGSILSSVSKETGIHNAPVIAVASHDTASAVAAVPADRENFVYISSGTWSLMGIETTRPVINDMTYKWNYTNEGGVCGTYRLLKNIMGLWIIQECKRTWDKQGEVEDYGRLTQRVHEANPFKCFIDPDYDEFTGPGNMPNKIAEYCAKTGQAQPQTKGEIVRCVLESLALKYRWAVERLEKIAGISVPAIHIVGGGVQNKVLCQFTANATGRPVIAGPIEATAIGNILVQAMALGEVKDLVEIREIVRNSFPTDEYMPQDVDQWDEAYTRFNRLIEY